MKSIEQRLFDAYQHGRGMRLSAADVDLLVQDDAIGTRISNHAAREAGAELCGDDCVPIRSGKIKTWEWFVDRFRKANQ